MPQNNLKLRLATLRHGMLDYLRPSPPPQSHVFAAAIRAHFTLKRGELAAQAAQWVADAESVAEFDASLVRAAAEAQAAVDDAVRAAEAAGPGPSPGAAAGGGAGGDVDMHEAGGGAGRQGPGAMGGAVDVRSYPNIGHVGLLLALARPFRGRAPVLRDVAAFVRARE